MNNRISIVTYFIIIFSSFFSIAMALPIFSPLILKTNILLSGSSEQKILWLGLLLTLYPLGQFFGAPFLGKLSDRYGRKKVLYGSLVLNAICFLACGLSIQLGSFRFLGFARLLLGLSSGSLAIAQAAFSDISKTFFKPRSYSIIYAMISFGFILGPLFGGFVSKFSYSLPFYCMSALLFLNAVLAAMNVRETIELKEAKKVGQFEIFHAIKVITTDRFIRPFFFKHLLIYLGIFSYFRFYVIYFIQTFAFTPMMLGIIISFCAIFSSVFQLIFAPIILQKMDGYKATSLASGIFAIGVLSLGMISKASFLPMALIPIASMIGLLLPFLALIISNLAKRNKMGHTMGANHSMQMLAEILSGLGGMWIAASSAIMPILLGGVSTLFGSLLFYRAYQAKFAKQI